MCNLCVCDDGERRGEGCGGIDDLEVMVVKPYENCDNSLLSTKSALNI